MQERPSQRPIRPRRAPPGPLAVLAALVLLGGCTPAQVGTLAGLSVVSYMETDKFLSDHLVSQLTGKDCAAANALDTGRMCKDPDSAVYVAEAPVYCYRTLGEITCYPTPDPYDSGAHQVQWPRAPEPGQWLAGRTPENEGH